MSEFSLFVYFPRKSFLSTTMRFNNQMAVENKFKLNVIAASVLMGLSLSAMAAGNDNAGDTGKGAVTAKKEATPTKVTPGTGFNPLAVAQASVPVDPVKFEYDSGYTLSSLFVTDGAVGAYNEAVKAAFGEKGTLGDKALSTISDYHQADVNNQQANEEWQSFADRAGVINHEYKTVSDSLYGAGHFGVYTDDLSAGNLSTLAGEADGTFGAYANGIKDFYDKLNNFQYALIGENGEGVASGLTSEKLNSHEAESLRVAVNNIYAYREYMKLWAGNKAAELKEQEAKSQIMATLPELQHFVTAWVNYSANGKDNHGPDLAGKYNSFTEAVSKLQNATDDNRSELRSALKEAADALSGAFNDVKVIDVHGEQGNIPVETKNKFQGLMTAVKNAVDTMSGTDNARTAWKTLSESGALKALPGNFEFPFDAEKGATQKLKVDSVQTALDGLSKALGVLCADDAVSTMCKDSDEHSVVAELKSSWATLMGTDGKGTDANSLYFKYHHDLANLKNLQGKLAAVHAEFSQKNQEYSVARKAFFAASDAYNSSDFKTAREAYENLKNAATGLMDVRNNLQNAIKSAAEGYAGDRKNGVPDENALTSSLSKLKALIPVKLQVDSLILDYQQKAGQKTDASGLSELSNLQAAYQSANEAKTKASDAYTQAVEAYKEAGHAYQAALQAGSGGNIDETKADLTIAAKNLLLAAGYNKALDPLTLEGAQGGTLISAVNKLHSTVQGVQPGTFISYADISGIDDFTPSALGTFKDAENNLTEGVVSTSRKDIAKGLSNLADLRVLYTDKEWADLKIGADDKGKGGQSLSDVYLAALESVGEKATSAEEQKKVANAESVTHYLGWADVGSYDFTAGRYNPVILETDNGGKVTGIKRDFSAADLYTGTQDNPFTTTVLNIEAPVMGSGNPAEANTITVGEAGTKDKKATPVDVWARTDSANGAVNLGGNLKTAISVAGKDGAPEVIRGADRIVLQNMNIHNSILADKVNTLAKDMTNIGLRIDTRTVDSLLDKDIGKALANLAGTEGTFGTADVKSAPNAANILLDNLNITLQNDSVGGTSTAISLSKTGNHILANGGVFDAGKAGNLAEANVLDITGADNLVELRGSTLKGDIRSDA
ncbi:TPA: hypothetical protein ACWV7L_005148, partial [Salmonella enterica subsp. enterica serovar Muenchen]